MRGFDRFGTAVPSTQTLGSPIRAKFRALARDRSLRIATIACGEHNLTIAARNLCALATATMEAAFRQLSRSCESSRQFWRWMLWAICVSPVRMRNARWRDFGRFAAA
jgi:hypothetical protein